MASARAESRTAGARARATVTRTLSPAVPLEMAKVYAGSDPIDEIRGELATLREEVQRLRASASGQTASPMVDPGELPPPKSSREASASLFAVESIIEEERAEIVVEPNSFHMIAIHCFLDERATRRERWTAFSISCGMVLLQVGALCAVVMGSGGFKACTFHDDCQDGMMCAETRGTFLCTPCFNPYDGEPFRQNPTKDVCFGNSSMITPENQEICDRCYKTVNKRIDFLHEMYRGEIKQMMIGDWANLLLASIVVSLTVVGELRDTLVLRVKIEKAWSRTEGFVPRRRWYYLCLFLNAIRWYIFLPLLCTTVPNLVWTNGSDALSICMNTIAVTFLVDLDNMVYDMGLEESTRQRVAEEGSVTLSHEDEEVIILAKYFHGAGCVLLMMVLSCSTYSWKLANFAFQVFFGLGGILTELNWFYKYQGRPTPLAAIQMTFGLLVKQWVPSVLLVLLLIFFTQGYIGILYEQPAEN